MDFSLRVSVSPWFNKIVFTRDLTILDGATGTELGRRGVDLSPPLWSARAIEEAPDILAQVHREYLEAGADAITTATFRTHRRSIAKLHNDLKPRDSGPWDEAGARARDLTRRAVEIARRVRDEVKPNALVLGCVAPLEACYRPEFSPPAAQCEIEHAEMIRNLLDAGVDGILIETMATLREAAAAVVQARDLAPAPGTWMISFLTKSDGPPGMLLDGDSLIDLLPSLHDAAAVGVNCIAAHAVEAEVQLLRRLLPPRMQISAYANTAEPAGDMEGESQWRPTDAAAPKRYAEYALRWRDAGATIIGGCCGTSPAHIREIAAALRK